MEKKEITEEMGLQKEWYERAKSMRPEDFPEFFRELTEDYETHGKQYRKKRKTEFPKARLHMRSI